MLTEEVKTMYSIRCNCCGKYYESQEGFALFNFKQTAEDYMEHDPRGWMQFEGEHYCPACPTEKEAPRLDKQREARNKAKE